MKTFADTHFSIRRNPAGIMGKIQLDNDVEISIIMHEYSYGGPAGLWEIACFDKEGQVDLECLDHDVVGYLTFTELETKIKEIQEELNNNNSNNK